MVHSHFFRILYLIAIAVAMIGWLWTLAESLAWALDIKFS
jgi:hypothetical protein